MAAKNAKDAEQNAAAASGVKEKEKPYADAFAKEDGVKEIPHGGWIKTLTEGTGPLPSADDTVKVNYRGTFVDGKEFDSSYKRNAPATFPLKNVIPCWTNGVAMMKVGGKSKLVCPSDVAYGDGGRPGIPGGSTLTFEVELLEIVKADAPKPDAKPAAKN
jgi:FKBP-type peptidyl-prolyl cis-trans isomerase FkpA